MVLRSESRIDAGRSPSGANFRTVESLYDNPYKAMRGQLNEPTERSLVRCSLVNSLNRGDGRDMVSFEPPVLLITGRGVGVGLNLTREFSSGTLNFATSTIFKFFQIT